MNVQLDENTVLCWNAGLVPLATQGGTLGLLLEHRQFLVGDPLLQHLIRLLQQPKTLGSLTEQASPPYDRAAIGTAVQELYSERVIVQAHARPISRNSAAFWDIVGSRGPLQPVAVVSLLPNFGPALEALLNANDVETRVDGDLSIVVTDDYLRPEVTELAANRKAVLLAKPSGNEIWIGPYLSREGPLCWECLAYWMRLRRWPELTVTGLTPTERAPSSSVAWLPSTMTIASGLIATVATLWAAGQPPGWTPGYLWTFDLHTLTNQAFPIMARRNCARCGPEASEDSMSFRASLQSPRTGIVDRLQESDGPVGFVYLANSAVLLPLPKAGVRDPLPPLSADGKGPTAEEAVRRCTMEAIERYSCVFVGDEPLVWGRIGELDGLHPAKLLLFSAAQLSAREDWNSGPGSLHGVPEAVDPERTTAWIKAQSLLNEGECYVPAGYAYLWYPFRGEPFYNYADTNGCAAGETFVDATLRGLLELIERDALAIWWYNRLRRPGVELKTWDDQDVQSARKIFLSNNRTLELLDLTHDLEIPVYAAVSADDKGENLLFGCAADVCGVNAAKRAIAELTQFWYWGLRSGHNLDQRLWLNKSSIQTHTYLVPDGQASTPQVRAVSTEVALTLCLNALRRAGIEAYSVNLTRPELGIPVVRVVAPGLRHYGPRFEAGRLYDVPVKLGWLPAPLQELALNPDPCIL